MDKESIYELQLLDCNCNDCVFMVRNNYKKKLQDQFHHKLQKHEFDREREHELFLAYTLRDKNLESVVGRKLLVKKSSLNYGYCKKFDFKELSFISNQCQLETQSCFEHRKKSTN